MMVCHCKAINSDFIAGQFNQPAMTLDNLTKNCGVGLDCGACLDLIEDMLEQSSTDRDISVFVGSAN